MQYFLVVDNDVTWCFDIWLRKWNLMIFKLANAVKMVKVRTWTNERSTCPLGTVRNDDYYSSSGEVNTSNHGEIGTFSIFHSSARHNDHLLMDVLSALITKRPNFEVNDMNNVFLRGPCIKYLDTTLVKRGCLWYCFEVFLEIFKYVFLRHKNKNVFK